MPRKDVSEGSEGQRAYRGRYRHVWEERRNFSPFYSISFPTGADTDLVVAKKVLANE